MKIEIIVIGIMALIYIGYLIYLKPYFQVRKAYQSLKKFLETRDSLVLRLVPDIQDKKMAKDIIKSIEERKLNFNSGQNYAILSDSKLNSKLKDFYEKYQQTEKNKLAQEVFVNVIHLEKNLKTLRKEYNRVVENYNTHLVKHKTVLFKLLKMKPLDTYGPGQEGRSISAEKPLGAQGFHPAKGDRR